MYIIILNKLRSN